MRGQPLWWGRARRLLILRVAPGKSNTALVVGNQPKKGGQVNRESAKAREMIPGRMNVGVTPDMDMAAHDSNRVAGCCVTSMPIVQPRRPCGDSDIRSCDCGLRALVCRQCSGTASGQTENFGAQETPTGQPEAARAAFLGQAEPRERKRLRKLRSLFNRHHTWIVISSVWWPPRWT